MFGSDVEDKTAVKCTLTCSFAFPAQQKFQLDRVHLQEVKRSSYEHTKKCADQLLLLGQVSITLLDRLQGRSRYKLPSLHLRVTFEIAVQMHCTALKFITYVFCSWCPATYECMRPHSFSPLALHIFTLFNIDGQNPKCIISVLRTVNAVSSFPSASACGDKH